VARVAANQKLWNQLMRQALAKYPKKSVRGTASVAANRWAASEYQKRGGQYVGSKSEVQPSMRDPKAEAVKKKKAKDTKVQKSRMRGDII
jgi:hypothetical protein